MKNIIFDGKGLASEKEKVLTNKVQNLVKRGVTPKLVTILVGNNPASILYTNLKKKAAERIGAVMEVERFGSRVSSNTIIRTINKLNKDNAVHGIMVQFPLPRKFLSFRLQIVKSIDPKKDVDGLLTESAFLPATVKAVLQIIEVAKKEVKHDYNKVTVVGASGMVGRPLVKILRELKYTVFTSDINTKDLSKDTLKSDLIISATGKSGLIKESMVKEGVTIIDIGAPKGDVDPNVYKKAAFYTPVPGGVGPVTISCLLENLVIASKLKRITIQS